MTTAGKFYVYALFRPWNGTPFYIGKGTRHRWCEHERLGTAHRNRHMAAIFKKAAGLDLKTPKAKIREGLTEAEAFETERALIAAVGRADKNLGPLANQTDGGEGQSGRIVPAEEREKHRANSMGNSINAAAREKIRLSKLGKPCAQATRDKIAAAKRGKPPPNLGKSPSPETRLKQSVARRAFLARQN